MEAAGTPLIFDEVLKSILQRDSDDEKRAAGPLKMADDATLLDTTFLTPEEVLQKLLDLVRAAEGKSTSS